MLVWLQSEEDGSSSFSKILYGIFVFGGQVVLTITMAAARGSLYHQLGNFLKSGDCLPLERDIHNSRGKSVHPCDNFYMHASNGWNRVNRKLHGNPMHKYKVAFSQNFVTKRLMDDTSRRLQRAEQKAKLMLLRCHTKVRLPFIKHFTFTCSHTVPPFRETTAEERDIIALGTGHHKFNSNVPTMK